MKEAVPSLPCDPSWCPLHFLRGKERNYVFFTKEGMPGEDKGKVNINTPVLKK
jgi:hypothetical protein